MNNTSEDGSCVTLLSMTRYLQHAFSYIEGASQNKMIYQIACFNDLPL